MSDLPNRISKVEPVRGERAYMYGFKARAHLHHCLGYGTFSIDVARLEDLRKEYSRRVGPITNLPIYLKATAVAIARNPEANAILFRGWFTDRIVHFERVDVNLPITRQVGDRWITFIATIRDATSKSLLAIQEEVTSHQRAEPESSPAIRRFFSLDRLPNWLIRLFHWRMTRDPAYYVHTAGTCGLTLTDTGDWGEYLFPIAPTSVVFGVGGIRKEPVVRNDQIVIARMLKCVMMADNYVIPGMLGTKLAKDFKELLESGDFIREEIERTVGHA